ncbi:nitrile hydratase accessory protein [Bosea thiooxidans]
MSDKLSENDGTEAVCGFDPRPWNADTGVIFGEPWQAQVFAMTVALNDAGLLSWKEWGDVFSAHRKASSESGRQDTGDTYYDDWLNALEEISAKRSLAPSEMQHRYRHAWEHATARTPHGQPILLQDGDFEHPGKHGQV